jgi:two-component system chemotaxis response regulator CheB
VSSDEDEKTSHEVRIAKEREALEEGILEFGELSPFTCPECHGVLTMLREDMITRFRCHTGHAFSAETLLESAAERCFDKAREAHERRAPVREKAIETGSALHSD